MTPTLFGRWQSRFFLLSTLGMVLTLPFAALSRSFSPFIILALVFALGLGWDILYILLQRERWDHDWPAILQVAAGIFEGLIVFGLLYGFSRFNNLPLPVPSLFWLHYTLVWLATFVASQSFMRLYFPRWRYRGGQWL